MDGPGPHYRQNLRVAYQVYDGVAFLVEPSARMMHRLDEVGTLIWEAVAEPATPETVAARVVEEFEVEPSPALEDARAFLKELARLGLVVEVPPI